MTSEYSKEAENLISRILIASKMQISKMNEQEKQILGTFCFGVLNGYAMQNQMSQVQVHGEMIAVLIKIFKYEPAAAAQFCDFLIKCTDKNIHPTMNAIIHRGIEGYYQLADEEKLVENISDIIQKVKKYNQ